MHIDGEDDRAAGDPTREEIAAKCAQIRKGWSGGRQKSKPSKCYWGLREVSVVADGHGFIPDYDSGFSEDQTMMTS